jgi:hypothetical protein
MVNILNIPNLLELFYKHWVIEEMNLQEMIPIHGHLKGKIVSTLYVSIVLKMTIQYKLISLLTDKFDNEFLG